MHYYGVTCQKAERRWRGNGRYYKTTSLQPYIEKYGWENIQHKVLFENISKEDALSIEDSLILSGREKGNCINKIRSGNVSKDDRYRQQCYQQNREKILEQQREYREQNREKIFEYHREYREQNREKRLEYQREYNKKNREKRLEYQREYNKKNREKYIEYKREYNKKNREKNREKKREYQREYQRKYRQKKKQLKEVETTPLF